MPAMPKWELETPEGLRRGLGSPALFGIVQGFIAASVYFSLGLVTQAALGFAWLVYLVAAVFFGLVVLSYVEGASLHQERGGATIIARYAFNELWSFVAGWAILLDYVLLIAITAFATTDYVAVLVGPVADGLSEFLFGAAVVIGVAWLNIRGAGSKRYDRFALAVVGDLVLQTTIVVLGLALLLNPDALTDPASIAGTPSASDLVLAFTLTLVTFAGVDASSGLAGEVAIGRRGLKRLVSARLLAFIPYVGISLVAVSVLPLDTGLAAGQDNYAIIPGLKITAPATLTAGVEDSFSVTVSNKGVGVMLKDYVDNLLDTAGYFSERKKGDDAINTSYNKRISDIQDRLDLKQLSLERKYTGLEKSMSRLQSQSSQLAAQLARLNA